MLVAALLQGVACTGFVEEQGGGSVSQVPGGADGTPTVDGRGGGAVPADAATELGVPNQDASPPSCGFAPARIWKLTPTQYHRTVRALVPGSYDVRGAIDATLTSSDTFGNDAAALQLSSPHVESLLAAATTVARQATSRLASVFPCMAAGAVDTACARASVAQFGRKAFRRPLTDEEIERYSAFVARQAEDLGPVGAAHQLVRAFLMSPHFLFRTELGIDGAGETATRLSAYEVAQAISYFVDNSPPDTALSAAADKNQLGTPAQIAAHVRRLMLGAGTAQGIMAFFQEHFDYMRVRDAAKDPTVYPDWNAGVASEMATETTRFVEEVLWRAGGKLSTLLAGDFSILNNRLATHYGVPVAMDPAFRKVQLPTAQRSGLLTQGSFLAQRAHDDDTDAVARGKYIRETILCQPLPPPPPNVAAILPAPTGDVTMRERLSQHLTDDTCTVCHTLMDPLGLAFENYDGTGAWRSAYRSGREIDTSGLLTGVSDPGGKFKNAVELSALLSNAPESAECFVTKLYTYATGQSDLSGANCAVDALAAAFQVAGGSIPDLIVGLTTSDDFVVRTRP
jgi:hypothetical protein